MSSISLPSTKSNNNSIDYLWFVPLLTPAVDKSNFKVDETSLIVRISIVASVALLAGIQAGILLLANPLVLTLGTAAYTCFEVLRANRAVINNALQEYLRSDTTPPSPEAMQCIAHSVKAIQTLIRNKSDLNKIDKAGKPILEYTSKSPENFQIFKLLVDNGAFVKPEFAYSIHSRKDWFAYLLEKKKLNPDEKDNQFDIDQLDEQGYSRLARAVIDNHQSLIPLLRCGANPEATIRHLGQQSTALAIATDPTIKKLLQQQIDYLQNPIPAPEANATLKKFSWIPLLTPALKENGCEVDRLLQSTRMHSVSILATGLMYLTTSLPFLAPSLMLSTVSLMILPLIDLWRSSKAAKANAISEYVHQAIPSKAATGCIVDSPGAIQTLIDKKVDLSKLNEEYQDLLSEARARDSFDAFKLLVDNGADIKRCLSDVIRYSNPQFLTYLCEKNLVKASDFSNEEQVMIWSRLDSLEVADLLVKQGFDINVVDKDGNTPLLKAIRVRNRFYQLNEYDLVVKLIALGANKNAANHDGKTAAQIATNKAVRQLFLAVTN